LQERYSSRGFSVLAFPISDFDQELASNREIDAYVRAAFPQVDFPIFSLGTLKENPVYQQLQRQVPDQHVRWNFFKYLVDRNGQVVHVFDLNVSPLSLAEDIEKLLDDPAGTVGHKLVIE
jgi:glutathione peroxidase